MSEKASALAALRDAASRLTAARDGFEAQILNAHAKGATLREISAAANLVPERVRQILIAAGIDTTRRTKGGGAAPDTL